MSRRRLPSASIISLLVAWGCTEGLVSPDAPVEFEPQFSTIASADYALDFDGTQQSTQTPDAPVLDLSSTWTIEAWINSPNVTSTVRQHVVSKWNGGGDASYALEVRDGRLRAEVHDGATTNTVESSQLLNDGQWHHLAVTFDNGTMKLYVDGLLDTTVSGLVTPMNSSRPLSFGHEGPPFNGWWYEGIVDEVRIWTTVQSQSNIQRNKGRKLSGSVLGLVGYWPLDEGAGDLAADATANGLDMQLGNAAGPDGGDPSWVMVTRVSPMTYDCTAQTDVTVPTCEALVALYASTNGDAWTDNTGWFSPKTSPCNWKGVGCIFGSFSSISLPSNNLDGTIPDEIGDLEFPHQGLYLNENRLRGQIPSSLGNLAGASPVGIEVLDLSHNELSGPIPELGGIAWWQLLLNDNELTGPIPRTITKGCLEELDLSNNHLAEDIPAELFTNRPPAGFTCSDNFSVLWLNHNDLSGSIPPEIGIHNWSNIDLSYNSIGGPIPDALFEPFDDPDRRIRNLHTLNLSHNHLEGPLPEGLSGVITSQNYGTTVVLRDLRELDLSNNELNGPVPAELAVLRDNSLGGSLIDLLLARNKLLGLVPLAVAEEFTPYGRCDFAANQLYVPDIPDYAGLGQIICELPLSGAGGVVANLKLQVANLANIGELDRRQSRPLTRHLERASSAIARDQHRQAVRALSAFIARVNSYVADGTLTAETGSALVSQAEIAINQLS